MPTSTVSLPTEVLPQVEAIVNTFGFKNKEEFVQEAVRDKILDLQKRLFFSGSDRISMKLRQKGITEKEVIDHFMKKTHQ